MIRCIVFDFDGVLVDSNSIKRSAYFEIFAPIGNTHAIVEASLAAVPDGNRYDVIETILQRLERPGLHTSNQDVRAVEFFAEKYNQICESYASACREMQGTSECLPLLRESFTLYINSATIQESLQRIVRRRGWDSYFRGVLGSPRTKVENLRWILERERLEPCQVVLLGDSHRDVSAARACGCHFVGMRQPDNDFDIYSFVMIQGLHELRSAISDLDRLSQC